MSLHEVLTPQELRAKTHARARNPETRAAAARMYGDGLTRGFSAAHGQRGAEVLSPWGSAGAATSGRMFLRAGEEDALAPSVHDSDGNNGNTSTYGGVGSGSNGGNNADERRGQVASRSSAPRGLVEKRIFPPPQPPWTDAEAAAAVAAAGRFPGGDYVDSVYGERAPYTSPLHSHLNLGRDCVSVIPLTYSKVLKLSS